jgi:hypothetical protein
MNQALYAHMKNKIKKKKEAPVCMNIRDISGRNEFKSKLCFGTKEESLLLREVLQDNTGQTVLLANFLSCFSFTYSS